MWFHQQAWYNSTWSSCQSHCWHSKLVPTGTYGQKPNMWCFLYLDLVWAADPLQNVLRRHKYIMLLSRCIIFTQSIILHSAMLLLILQKIYSVRSLNQICAQAAECTVLDFCAFFPNDLFCKVNVSVSMKSCTFHSTHVLAFNFAFAWPHAFQTYLQSAIKLTDSLIWTKILLESENSEKPQWNETDTTALRRQMFRPTASNWNKMGQHIHHSQEMCGIQNCAIANHEWYGMPQYEAAEIYMHTCLAFLFMQWRQILKIHYL